MRRDLRFRAIFRTAYYLWKIFSRDYEEDCEF
jgi:hypothetical protein